MNWLTDFVRPKIRALYAKRRCRTICGIKCPELRADDLPPRPGGEPARLPALRPPHAARTPTAGLKLLFDEAASSASSCPRSPVDPLRFRDQKRYSDRLKEAQTKTGENDAIRVAHGRSAAMPAVVAAFDFGFMGGSMGIAVGEGLLAAARLAVLQEAPLIVVPSSGGARMQEGILSLMQMPRTTIAVQSVKEAGLPYIVVLTDPTTGGVTASFAMLGDIAYRRAGRHDRLRRRRA